MTTLSSYSPSYSRIISISPLVISNGEIITVAFESSDPSVDDWIGAYSPPEVDILTTVPIKYACCTGICNTTDFTHPYLTTNKGILHFNLTNLRAGIKFYYFTGGILNPTVMNSSSSIVQFKEINEPIRNRIVPTGDPNIFQLLWSTANASLPYVKWGLKSGHYPFRAKAVMSKISSSELCGSPANTTGWFDLGMINQANITGILEKHLDNQNIYYRFGDEKLQTISKEFVFHVPPSAGRQPTNRGTTVALLGDLGYGSYGDDPEIKLWHKTCPAAVDTILSISSLIKQNQVDAAVLTGDISYADGFLSTYDFFLDMLSPVAGGVLFFTTVGNHESDYPGTSTIYDAPTSGGECGVVSGKLLPMPAPATIQSPWWSYDIGIIHFVAISTEHNYVIGSEQYLWLEHDLSSVNRTKTPWVLFTGHRPMYVDSSDCCILDSDVASMNLQITNIEHLLFKYRVNLAFSGHFHNLQRQAAVYRNKTVQHSQVRHDEKGNKHYLYEHPQATVWMIVGASGNGPNASNKNYSWSEKSWNGVYGYALVTAVNATTLHWNLIESSTNQVIDRVVITQNFEEWKIEGEDISWLNNDVSMFVFVASGLLLTIFLIQRFFCTRPKFYDYQPIPDVESRE